MDLAVLGYEIRSDSVSTANRRLDDMAQKAGRTERATDRMAARASASFVSVRRVVLAAAAALGAFIGAALSLRQFTANTIEAEKVQAQLASAIRSTGGVAGQTASNLNAHAAALQKVTTYGDEAVNRAQALLLTFTQIRGSVFPQATEAVLNLATAMGTDLSSAVLQVGKALNDPILGMTALSRSGIQFSEDQKKMVKEMVRANDVMGAQQLILRELETQFGGSARAARNTLGGALTALRNAWGDLFELNGTPEAERLRGSIESMVDKITDPRFVQAVRNFGVALFDAIDKAIPGVQAILNFITQIKDFALPQEGANLRTQWGDSATQHLADVLSGRSRPSSSLAGGAGFETFDFSDLFTGNNAGLGKTNRFRPPVAPPTGGGVGSDAAAKAAQKMAEAYANLVRDSNQFIEAQRLEAQVLGMTEEAANRLRFEQEMLNQAANDNISLTPTQREEIARLADQMAVAEEATRRLTEAYDFGRQTLGSFFSDLKTELMNGTSLWGSFANAAAGALDSIADRALSMAADGIWNMIFGAFTGGLGGGMGGAWNIPTGFQAGGFFPSFAGGGFTGAGSRAGGIDGMGGFPAILHPNETVVDHTAANGNGPNININIDARGATRDAGPEIARQVRAVLPDAMREYERNNLRRAG